MARDIDLEDCVTGRGRQMLDKNLLLGCGPAGGMRNSWLNKN